MSTYKCKKCGGAAILHGEGLRCLVCGASQGLRVQPGWFNVSGAAQYLGCSRAEVRRLTNNGILVRHGRRGSKRKWYARADLDALHVPEVLVAAGGG